MAGCVRVVVLVAMMLATMVSAAWAAQCSDATSFLSVGTFTKTFANTGDGFLAGGNVPFTLAPGDRISNTRVVWSVNGGRTVNSSLFARLNYPGQFNQFETGPFATGVSNGTTNFAFPQITNTAQSSFFVGFQLNSATSSTVPAADGTTVLTAEISVLCVPAPDLPTTTTVSSAPNPSVFSQNVALTANVTATSGTPIGTVEFFDDGASLGAATLTGGTATLNTTALAIGGNSITARYNGATGFTASTSPIVVHTVNRFATQLTLTSSLNPSLTGQSVTFTATATNLSGAALGAPVGTVEFREGTTVLASAELDGSGSASFATSALSVGGHPITAHYLGNIIFSQSISAPLNQVVGSNATTTTVSSAPNPSTPSQAVVLTANVSAASGTPTGTVQFFDDGTSLGSSSLASGAATLSTTALVVGTNNITAVYSGAAGFTTSTSAAAVHTVNLLGTQTTLSSSLNPSLVGQAVTFTATITNELGGSAPGIVEFREGATVLGTGTIGLNGVLTVTFTTSSLTAATHPITAHYLGNETYAPSASAPLTQVVNALPGTTDFSKRIDDVQEAATGVAATLASDGITDSVAEEIASALSGQVQVFSASEGKVGLVYAPGIGKGTVISPTADLASGENSVAAWRIWSSLRYTDFDSSKLEGDQVNALLGASFLFGDGLTAGLVAGYEKQDYEDDVNATLKGEGFNIGGYAGGTLGNGIRFDAQVHTSLLNYDLASGLVTGETDAKRLIVSGGFAHMMQFGATTFEPTARVNGTWEWQDGYTDSAAVAHGSRNFNFGRIATGAKLAHRFDLGDGASFQPFVNGFADYRFSGGDTTNETLLDGLSARVGLGAQLNTASGITASVLGELSGLGLKNNALAKSVKAQIAIPF